MACWSAALCSFLAISPPSMMGRVLLVGLHWSHGKTRALSEASSHARPLKWGLLLRTEFRFCVPLPAWDKAIARASTQPDEEVMALRDGKPKTRRPGCPGGQRLGTARKAAPYTSPVSCPPFLPSYPPDRWLL